MLATTLGETGGDWVSMSLNLGYLVGSAIFAAIFVALVWSQVKASRFHPALFWATIVATTTLGTTMADFADRSLGIGYPGGVAIVASLLAASLLIWRWSEGTVSVANINTPRAEWFYWCTILFSQTLGTALGDWLAGTDRGGLGLGYEYGALVFGSVSPSWRRCTSGRRSRARPVLGRLHPDPAARRHAGRPSRQAHRQWRPELQPLGGLARVAGLHRRLRRPHPAACGQTRAMRCDRSSRDASRVDLRNAARST